MSDTNRLLNETRDKLSETILRSQNIRVAWPVDQSTTLEFEVQGGIPASVIADQIQNFRNSTNLLIQTVDSMTAFMRSINNLLESFSAIFKPSSIKQTELITRAQEISQKMNDSLQLINAVVRDANDNIKILPQDVDKKGFTLTVVTAYNKVDVLLTKNPGLVQSLNTTLPLVHQVDVILLHITEYLNAPK